VGCAWEGMFASDKRYQDLSTYIYPDSPFIDQMFNDYAQVLRRLIEAGKRVVLVLPTPMGMELAPSTMLTMQARLAGRITPNQGIDRRRLEDRLSFIVSKLKQVARDAGAEIIDPIDYLCDETHCPSLHDGKPVAKDGSHYRPFFARERARFFDHLVIAPQPVVADTR